MAYSYFDPYFFDPYFYSRFFALHLKQRYSAGDCAIYIFMHLELCNYISIFADSDAKVS